MLCCHRKKTDIARWEYRAGEQTVIFWCSNCGAYLRSTVKRLGDDVIVNKSKWHYPKREGGTK